MVCFSLKGDKNGWAQEVLGPFRQVQRFYGFTGEQKANAKFSKNKKILKDPPPIFYSLDSN